MNNERQMEKYEFLVLIDFTEASNNALKYGASLAKKVGASIRLFHVNNSSEIETYENQFSTLRSLKEEQVKILDRLKSDVKTLQEEGIEATYSFVHGNDKDEIENQIELTKPDLVVIGRRKLRLNYRGGVTSYLLNSFKGRLLIIGANNEFHSKTNISLACSRPTLEHYDLSMVFEFHDYVSTPLSVVNVLHNSSKSEKIEFINSHQHFQKTEGELTFEYPINQNISAGLIEHISQKNIELICLGRSMNTNWILNRFFGRGSTSLSIASRINIPILILDDNTELRA